MANTLLYGGTFDPVHHGHLITCLLAREILGADRVVLLPARVSPHKLEAVAGATGEERLAMLRAAIAGAEEVARLEIDGRELSRAGPSYTVDTIKELMRENPRERFTLLIGADQLLKLHTWHRVGELLASNVAILPRSEAGGAGEAEAGLLAVRQHLGAAIAEDLTTRMLDTPRIDISATDIRERVRRGLPIDFLVPPAVAEFIRLHGLYRR